MNRLRYLVSGLLCLTGVLHVARLGIPPSDTTLLTIAVVFGVAYLIIGGLLFLNNKTAYYLGAIVPLIGLGVGLCGGLAGVLAEPSAWMVFLAGIDAVIMSSCFYLLKKRRAVATV